MIQVTPARSGPGSNVGPGAGSAATTASPATDDEEDQTGSAAAAATGPAAPREAKARPAWLREKLAAAIAAHPGLAREKLGVAVVDLVTGEELFSHEPDVGLNLASNTKLLTTAAALGVLGSGFKWRTSVYADKLDDATGAVDGDLYLRGRGDPVLSQRDLRELANDVAGRGVREVSGRLVVDTGYFDNQVEPPHYDEQPDERAGFRAPVGSLGVSRNATTVVVTAVPGGPAAVRIEPDAGDYVRITKREVTTVATGHTRIKVVTKPKSDHLEIEVTARSAPSTATTSCAAASTIRRAMPRRCSARRSPSAA